MSNYGKYTPEQFREHIAELEGLFGGQKGLADKLGVDVSTLRRWKTGAGTPKKETITKLNRTYGANKNKLERPDIQERVRKQKRKTENLRKGREAQRKRERQKVLDISVWVDKFFSKDPIWKQSSILNMAREYGLNYAVYIQDSPREAQWISIDQYMKSQFGKPKKIRSFFLIGTVRHYPYVEENQSLIIQRRDTLSYFSTEWTLEQALDMARDFFFQEVRESQKGRRNPNEPEEFISYFFS